MVKLSLYRPGETLGYQEIYRQSVVSPRHRPHLPHGKYSCLGLNRIQGHKAAGRITYLLTYLLTYSMEQSPS